MLIHVKVKPKYQIKLLIHWRTIIFKKILKFYTVLDNFHMVIIGLAIFFLFETTNIQFQAMTHVQNIEDRLKGILKSTSKQGQAKPKSVALSIEGHVNHLINVSYCKKIS